MRIQIQRFFSCDKCSNDLAEFFLVGHCVYLVLQKQTNKKLKRNPSLLGLIINTQCQGGPRVRHVYGHDWAVVLFSHRCMWSCLSDCLHVFSEKSCKVVQWFNLTKVGWCCWEVKILNTKLEMLSLLANGFTFFESMHIEGFLDAEGTWVFGCQFFYVSSPLQTTPWGHMTEESASTKSKNWNWSTTVR